MMVKVAARFSTLAAAAAAVVLTAPAAAETLLVEGWYAAADPEASQVESIAIERIRAEDGFTLERFLERDLGRLRGPDGAPYFDLLASPNGTPPPEGLIQADVDTRVAESRFNRTVRECRDRSLTECEDADKVDVQIPCRRRTITTAIAFRLVAIDTNRVIASHDYPHREEVSWCRGDEPPRDVRTVVEPWLSSASSTWVGRLGPRFDRDRIRIRESRSGMERALGDEVRALVRQTDRDPAAACAGWQGLAASGASHPTIAFNAALCLEQAGDIEGALAAYRSVPVGSRREGDLDSAIARVRSRLNAMEIEAARGGG
jgi:hypothetical protein